MFVKEPKDRRRTNAMVVCAFLNKVALPKGLRDEKRTIFVDRLARSFVEISREKIARGKRNYTSLDFAEYNTSKSRITRSILCFLYIF